MMFHINERSEAKIENDSMERYPQCEGPLVTHRKWFWHAGGPKEEERTDDSDSFE
jgi:hypothetical protein